MTNYERKEIEKKKKQIEIFWSRMQCNCVYCQRSLNFDTYAWWKLPKKNADRLILD